MKNFLLICVKNALNAILTNAALIGLMHGEINTYSTNGLWNIAKVSLAVIAAREIVVWGPIVMKWTTTNADPNTTVMMKIPKA